MSFSEAAAWWGAILSSSETWDKRVKELPRALAFSYYFLWCHGTTHKTLRQ
jgi:hypothetical protein